MHKINYRKQSESRENSEEAVAIASVRGDGVRVVMMEVVKSGFPNIVQR